MAARKKTAAAPRARKSRKPQSARGPNAPDMALEAGDAALKPLGDNVRARGGTVLATYRDPFAGAPVLMAALPIKTLAETPFQRDLSRTHADRLVKAIGDAGIFLDPVIAIPGPDGFLVPNGRHRLEAARQLGLQALTALIVPDRALAWRILALNTEKAHNLKDRSLEVIRMARALAAEQPRASESDHAVAFESAPLLTLGATYELKKNFAGSSYQSMLRRVDTWLPGTLPAALRQRDQYAQRLLDLDEQVGAHIKTLQELGFKSPYLRAFVVARCNPVRFVPPSRKKDAAPPMSMAVALSKFAAAVKAFKPGSVKPQDLALVAAVASPESAEE